MDFDISQEAKLPTRFGEFIIQAFREKRANGTLLEHLVVRTKTLGETPLVRVHSECLTGDVFGSQKCDCGGELALAMEQIAAQEPLDSSATPESSISTESSTHTQTNPQIKPHTKHGGLLIYLRQEGRGIGLFNKVNAYALQDQGYDTVEANLKLGFKSDERDYAIVGLILAHYGIKRLRLLTNNPRKIDALSAYASIERDSIIIPSNKHNEKYLCVKKHKLGHLL